MSFSIPQDLSTWDNAFEAKYPTCGARFKSLTVDTQKLKALSDPKSSNTKLDLSFLKDLTTTDDNFIPSGTILIRQCMREVFQRFDRYAEYQLQKDAKRIHVVLLGSPGVGKSLLSFLAALHLAHKSKPVIFLHITESDLISIFVICGPERAREENPMVQIASTRTFSRSLLSREGLNGLSIFLKSQILNIQSRKDWFVFLDGPRHDEETHTLGYDYNFFCTSGGHPRFKDHQLATFRRWVLDGWSEEDSIEVLQMHGLAKRTAKEVYALCGGNVRKMLHACTDFEEVKEELDDLTDEMTYQNTATLIDNIHFATSDRSPKKLKLPDQLITMFKAQSADDASNVTSNDASNDKSNKKSSDKTMRAVQYIDSQYVLTRLTKCIDVKAFKVGYDVSVKIGDSAMQERFYKWLIHNWLDRNVNAIAQKVCWSTATQLEGLEQFTEENVYWIPSVSNCADIDAGLVHDGTLHLFRYTVMDNHKFNKESFEGYLLHHVTAQIPTILKVIIHFVTPTPRHLWKGLVGDETFTYTSCNAPDVSKSISAQYVVNQLVLDGSNITIACNSLFSSASALWARHAMH